MKNLFFAFLTVLSVIVIGCNSSETSTESTPADANTTTSTPAQTPAEQTPPPAQENTVVPVTPDGAASTTVAPTGDVKLNPPHGEPGHRCDIAVGAPLPM